MYGTRRRQLHSLKYRHPLTAHRLSHEQKTQAFQNHCNPKEVFVFKFCFRNEFYDWLCCEDFWCVVATINIKSEVSGHEVWLLICDLFVIFCRKHRSLWTSSNDEYCLRKTCTHTYADTPLSTPFSKKTDYLINSQLTGVLFYIS